MSGQAGINETDLHAWIDGELAPDRIRAVEAAIRSDPSLAARAAAFRADRQHLKQAYGPLVDRSIPVEWIMRARGPRGLSFIRHNRRFAAIAAIAAVLLCLITAGGIYAVWESVSAPGEIVQAALDARDTVSRPAEVIPVSANSNPRRYDRDVATAVGLKVRVPDMKALGYRLEQIRLYRVGKSGAAELSYRDTDGRLFTLYLRHSDGSVRFDQFTENGLRICIWQDEDLGTVMTGNVSTAAMQRLASLAYTGLTL